MRNCTLIQCSIISKGAIATVPGYQGFNIIPGRYTWYLYPVPGTRYRFLVVLVLEHSNSFVFLDTVKIHFVHSMYMGIHQITQNKI